MPSTNCKPAKKKEKKHVLITIIHPTKLGLFDSVEELEKDGWKSIKEIKWPDGMYHAILGREVK